ncbi:hypothetical protein SFMTTN_3424 [Sulfuriferula multivorans]|uniref:Uncharacterized protein n=1 Tax=Sulfuriferula multivorans TaxID=1559896 RepID=A0A401K101_9PROT|nr:hypothetical protein SFMTTN_3424 [Sulfuriferula multivorans]
MIFPPVMLNISLLDNPDAALQLPEQILTAIAALPLHGSGVWR